MENLKSKLNIIDEDNIIEKLNYFIFNLGEKGRIYQLRYFKNLRSKSIFPIEDTSEKIFEYIFKKINHVLKTSKNPEIKKFILNNESFNLYFLDIENVKIFISNIKNLKDSEKLERRDYYLEFLHRVGYVGFYLNSFMLSTTKSKQVANEFTTDGDIIFVSWNRRTNYRISSNKMNPNFPTYNIGIFRNQKEITLKGGFFPQEILGFIEKSTSIFHLNPNIFNYPELIDYMIKNGIPTDQNNFHEILARTNYSGSFHSDGENLTDNL